MSVEAKKLHSDLNLAGFRALATASGLLQLVRELRTAGVIEEAAVDRIREAMISELLEGAPRTVVNTDYEDRLRSRLKALFAGQERLHENVVAPPETDLAG